MQMIWIAELASAMLTIPLVVLGLQCFVALLWYKANRGGHRPSLAVLIPAHNEQGVIGQPRLRQVRQQLI
jgi:hypothetical protein